MAAERRTKEASGLREFCDRQIIHIHQMVSEWWTEHEVDQHKEEDKNIVESFVDASNRKMRVVGGYINRLRPAVRNLYTHVLQVAEQVPGPVEVDSASFSVIPLVNAMFVNRHDVEDVMVSDPELKKFLYEHHRYQAPVVYAFLSAVRHERKILGVGMQGDVMVHDVPQVTVSFADHRIHGPSLSYEEVKVALKKYLFDRLVAIANGELKARELQQFGNRSANNYEARINSLSNPEVYLNQLIDFFHQPPELLRLEKTHLKLSKLGVKLSADDHQVANEFDLYELVWHDGSRHAITLVEYCR